MIPSTFSTSKVMRAMKNYFHRLSHQPSQASSHLYGMGEIATFEEKLRNFYRAKYALSFSSGTNALTALALVLGLKNSEIITSPYNYGSSIGGLKLLNNQIIFTQVKDNLTIEPSQIEALITPNTKAIWTVDFGGYPHDMKAVKEICYKYEIWHISDAAQSMGAYIDSLPASSLADAFVVSFTHGKTLSTFEGAAILTNNQEIYQQLLHFTHPNRVKLEVDLNSYNEIIPINGRLNPLAAVMGNAIFDDTLEDLKEYQKICFDFLIWLEHQNLVTLPIIPRDEIPTFFYIFGYLKPNISLETLNTFLKQANQSFTARLPNFQPLCENYSQANDLVIFRYEKY